MRRSCCSHAALSRLTGAPIPRPAPTGWEASQSSHALRRCISAGTTRARPHHHGGGALPGTSAFKNTILTAPWQSGFRPVRSGSGVKASLVRCRTGWATQPFRTLDTLGNAVRVSSPAFAATQESAALPPMEKRTRRVQGRLPTHLCESINVFKCRDDGKFRHLGRPYADQSLPTLRQRVSAHPKRQKVLQSILPWHGLAEGRPCKKSGELQEEHHQAARQPRALRHNAHPYRDVSQHAYQGEVGMAGEPRHRGQER